MRVFKYHGLGNDFVLAPRGVWPEDPGFISRVCDRHTGLGADGVIFYEVEAEVGARMVIYNQDGSRPEMCGNGIRCLAAHLHRSGALEGPTLEIESDAGPRPCTVVESGTSRAVIEVAMGEAQAADGAGDIGGHTWTFVDMGNPHAVVFWWPTIEEMDRVGEALNSGDVRFEQGVNVEFVRELGAGRYETIVYERGVGRTQACGTGACAVAAAVWELGRHEGPCEVTLPGGPLGLERRLGQVWMTGPAQAVCSMELSPGWA